MATQAQLDSWRYHRDICLQLEITQSTLRHRGPEGSIVAGGNARNKRYVAPTDRISNQNVADIYSVWAFWKQKEIRITSLDAGDTSAAESWSQWVTVQFPSIDDNGNAVIVQDNDWLEMPDGNWLKIENPVQDASGGYWYASGMAQR